ncbi:histidine kinase [Actinoplanes sp. NPDC051851]|uniref:sensor histidine kinase n=1 Tax=Actinoplanes sp. NPDC051851 TaxID=3154753 RepID=UPI00343111A1
MRIVYLLVAATLVGVPAGLAMTGGNTRAEMTVSLAASLVLLVLAARRWPRTALILSVLLIAAWRSARLIDTGWVWPATAIFVMTVLAGRIRTAAGTAAIALAYGLTWDWVVSRHSSDWAFAHVGGEALWLAAVLAGVVAYVSNRREREVNARRRRAEERVEIARDLHDVVSHTLAVVGVHLNVALDAFDDDPEEAREALKLAQEVRGGAMTDLKTLIGVLRADRPPALEQLVDRTRDAGLAVSMEEFGTPVELPEPVTTTIYRVVQEALTNTVRHAGASRTWITLRYAPHSVLVDVRDDGRGSPGHQDGNGITGMRERVAALGGALTAGPGDSGFTVRATLPLGK